MIRFNCRCGFRFELPDDQSGDVIQCRQCGLLNDVPTLDDLPYLTSDGSFDISIERPTDNPQRIAQLGLIYSKGTRDVEGDEIDLRIGMNELEGDIEAGSAAIPLAPISPGKPTDPVSRPRYDPETGERVVPIDLKRPAGDRVNPDDIPVAKRAPALTYANFTTSGIRPRRMMLDLLMPASLVVLFIIFVVQIAYQLFAVVAAKVLGAVGLAPEIVLLPLVILLMAHYANVVTDTGPSEHDEIQRPLRDMGLFDDICSPFALNFCALLLCYSPLLLAVRFAPDRFLITALAGVGLMGSLIYPAVLLTILTSGSVLDLNPVRLIGMIRVCGSQYWVSFSMWIVTGPLLLITVLTPRLPAIVLPPLNALNEPAIFVPLAAVTIYLAHLFHWHLGLLYRANAARFPWVLQTLIMDRPRVLQIGDAAADPLTSRPARSTRDKLRSLREAERRRVDGRDPANPQVQQTRRPPSSIA